MDIIQNKKYDGFSFVIEEFGSVHKQVMKSLLQWEKILIVLEINFI